MGNNPIQRLRLCELTSLKLSNVLGLITSRFCLLRTSLTSLLANILSTTLSAPSTRPPTSMRFTDCPNMSIVRSMDADLGIQDLLEKMMLLSTEAPALSMVENPESSMFLENFLWSRLNFFSKGICSRISRVSCFSGLDVSIKLVRWVQMKLPTWLTSCSSRRRRIFVRTSSFGHSMRER